MFKYYRSTQYRPKLKERRDAQPGGWIRCTNPTDEELATLENKYGLDIDILRDSLDPHEVPRVEKEDDWTYLITRLPDMSDSLTDYTTPTLFAIGREHIITVSRRDLSHLWKPFLQKVPAPTTQRNRFFMLMLEDVILQYNLAVTDINRKLRASSDNLANITTKRIAHIVEFERKLNDYLDALKPTNDALEKILSGKFFTFYEDDRDIIEDLSVDLEQIIARCKSLLRTITNLRDSYRAVMDTRLNETMRNLTLITLCLTIPTMIAGLFGMNVKIPFAPDSGNMFWIILGVSALASLIVVAYFSRRNR